MISKEMSADGNDRRWLEMIGGGWKWLPKNWRELEKI
jgi:hypothetical protein